MQSATDLKEYAREANQTIQRLEVLQLKIDNCKMNGEIVALFNEGTTTLTLSIKGKNIEFDNNTVGVDRAVGFIAGYEYAKKFSE